MSFDLKLQDSLKTSDDMGQSRKNGMFRTQVLAGYDAFQDKNGVTRFGQKIFEEENMIVLGGSLFTLEKVFGVKSGLTVEFLEDFLPGFKVSGETPLNEFYPKGTVTCLFGVGTGGCGESSTDVKDVKYYERGLVDMIPFRQSAEPLTSEEQQKYWFRKTVNVGGVDKVAYYLKTFESAPEIKVLWNDAEEYEDGSEVQNNVHETASSNTTSINTFIEITFKITAKDVREFFVDNGTVEQTRINTIGLFTGIKHNISTGPTVTDYRQVKMFSKLNFNNEMLVLPKDLTFVYRIFTS